MKEYIRSLRRRFRTGQHLATFMGVSPETVRAWCKGRRTPRGAELRFLEVLGLLATQAPELFATLVQGATVPKLTRALPMLAPLPRPLIPPTQRETNAAAREEKAYWLAQWDMPGASAIDNLADEEYERIGRLIGKLT